MITKQTVDNIRDECIKIRNKLEHYQDEYEKVKIELAFLSFRYETGLHIGEEFFDKSLKRKMVVHSVEYTPCIPYYRLIAHPVGKKFPRYNVPLGNIYFDEDK
jgi:hypothetical protein